MAEIYDLATHPAKFVSVSDLAEYWNVSVRTIERDIRKGALPVHRVGSSGIIRIAVADARAYGKPNQPAREAEAERDRRRHA